MHCHFLVKTQFEGGGSAVFGRLKLKVMLFWSEMKFTYHQRRWVVFKTRALKTGTVDQDELLKIEEKRDSSYEEYLFLVKKEIS